MAAGVHKPALLSAEWVEELVFHLRTTSEVLAFGFIWSAANSKPFTRSHYRPSFPHIYSNQSQPFLIQKGAAGVEE